MTATKHAAPQVRRFIEQRWLLDNVIAANGVDWDQPRTIYLGAPLGLEAQSDFVAIRARVKKFADCSPAFQAQGRRREGRAKEALEAGNNVTARENYLMAAVHWGAAQWPFDENNDENLFCNTRKRECYTAYAKLAVHKIEEVWIPFKGAKLPAWLHLRRSAFQAHGRVGLEPAAHSRAAIWRKLKSWLHSMRPAGLETCSRMLQLVRPLARRSEPCR
jgi:hypothetical protein